MDESFDREPLLGTGNRADREKGGDWVHWPCLAHVYSHLLKKKATGILPGNSGYKSKKAACLKKGGEEDGGKEKKIHPGTDHGSQLSPETLERGHQEGFTNCN